MWNIEKDFINKILFCWFYQKTAHLPEFYIKLKKNSLNPSSLVKHIKNTTLLQLIQVITVGRYGYKKTCKAKQMTNDIIQLIVLFPT